MSRWKHELTELVEIGAQMAQHPDAAGLRRGVRRRRAARVALPAGAAVAVIAAGALVVPGLFRQPLDPGGQVSDSCGRPVLEAAASAFGIDQAFGPGEGVVDVVAGANQVVEQGASLAIGVGVLFGDSNADAFHLYQAGENYVAAWLVDDDGEVIGVLEPEFVASPDGQALDGPELWLDGSYQPISCDGGPAGVGEYSIVTAVALAPRLGDDHVGELTAVLSEAIPLRIAEPDPLTGLGTCGATWPAGVVEATDGYALGLRLSGNGADATVADDGLRLAVTVTNDGAEDLGGWTGHPTLVLVRDGVVVGGTDAMDGEGLDASLAPGAVLDYDGWAPLTACDSGEALAAGTYEVYAIMSFFFTSPAGEDGPEGNRTDVTAVGGPWEISLG